MPQKSDHTSGCALRHLYSIEIAQLEANYCSATDWSLIFVPEKFTPEAYQFVEFRGECHLGTTLGATPSRPDFASRPTGIYHAIIEDCSIGNEVYIGHIGNKISNYSIGEGSIISHVFSLTARQGSSCGVGTKVSVLDETGGRALRIVRHLPAAVAYCMVFGKADKALMQAWDEAVDLATSEVEERGYAAIGKDNLIAQSGILEDISTEHSSTIIGVQHLAEGYIGCNVKMQGSIVSEHFIVEDDTHLGNCSLQHCYVGEGCRLDGGFSAHDSLIFANSNLSNGEASAAFLGPYTVSMHRSTLLIGGAFSFFNAGSGTNQSNHQYRLGPIHHGLMERGVKCSSDSYMLWPARVGAFSKLVGRFYRHPDTAELPFAVLTSDGGEMQIQPAVTIGHIGTWRDFEKWPLRDNRTSTLPDDRLVFRLWQPAIMYRVWQGWKQLTLAQELAQAGKTYHHLMGGCTIAQGDITPGIQLYHALLSAYIGRFLYAETSRTLSQLLEELSAIKATDQPSPILDLMGFAISEKDYLAWRTEVAKGGMSCAQIKQSLEQHALSQEAEKEWILQLLRLFLSNDLEGSLRAFIEAIPTAEQLLQKRIFSDGRKELSPARSSVGFGLLPLPEAEKVAEEDFLAVRQDLIKQDFVGRLKRDFSQHIEQAEKLKERLLG